MTPPDPRAWRVAIALGLEMEPPLDWARWARGETRLARHVFPIAAPTPWDADAYRLECTRRGVEPGPMPSLEGVCGDVRWAVDRPEGRMRVSFFLTGAATACAVWLSKGDALVLFDDDDHGRPNRVVLPRRIVDIILRLATAAAKAMGT